MPAAGAVVASGGTGAFGLVEGPGTNAGGGAAGAGGDDAGSAIQRMAQSQNVADFPNKKPLPSNQ